MMFFENDLKLFFKQKKKETERFSHETNIVVDMTPPGEVRWRISAVILKGVD